MKATNYTTCFQKLFIRPFGGVPCPVNLQTYHNNGRKHLKAHTLAVSAFQTSFCSLCCTSMSKPAIVAVVLHVGPSASTYIADSSGESEKLRGSGNDHGHADCSCCRSCITSPQNFQVSLDFSIRVSLHLLYPVLWEIWPSC